MDFTQILDKSVKEYEEFKKAEKDNNKKILLTAIIGTLKELRSSYFREWQIRNSRVQENCPECGKEIKEVRSNLLVEQFLKEIIQEHADVDHVCEDYTLILTEENMPFVKEMTEIDDNEERKEEDLKKLAKSKAGDKWYMYGFDRNHYVKQKMFPKRI